MHNTITSEMDNKSFEPQLEGDAEEEKSHHTTKPDSLSVNSGSNGSGSTSSNIGDEVTLPITEEDRLRQQIETYKEMIKNLEASSTATGLREGGGGGGDMYPSSSRSPLNGAASTSSLSNTFSEFPTIDLQSQRKGLIRKDLPLDYGKDVVLLNSFRVGRKRHNVYLNEGRLTWEKERRGDSLKDIAIPDSKAAPSFHRQIVPVEDILCVRLLKNSKKTSTGDAGDHPPLTAPEDADSRATTFQIHYARRRTGNPNMWKNVAIKFHNPDGTIVARWVATLQDILSVQQHRPRHILMFVNPYGGKRVAMTIYNKTAKPLFQLADIDVSLVVTQRQNQVTDIIMNNYLEQYDGIVCCGGDGTFNELYNGLVRREMVQTGTSEKQLMDLELPRPRIPIGVIPGGSTNTISYCMNGTDDIKTAVLNIVLGKVDGMDLSSVHRNDSSRELLRLYASVMSYGFLGDVSKEAEHYRSLGPKRYDYVGVKRFFKNAGYEAEIKILVGEQGSGNRVSEECKCLEGCERCAVAVGEENGKESRGMREELKELDRGAGAVGDVPDDYQERWKVIRGKFFMISGANISCACERSPNGLSPYCHIGDGCLDLILVKHSTFLNNLRLASRLSASGQHIVSDMRFI